MNIILLGTGMLFRLSESCQKHYKKTLDVLFLEKFPNKQTSELFPNLLILTLRTTTGVLYAFHHQLAQKLASTTLKMAFAAQSVIFHREWLPPV